MSAAGCGHHDGHPRDRAVLADELRKYVVGALEMVEPYIEQVRDAPSTPPADGEPGAPACDSCPVCAVITVMRGGRSELAARLAEQATGLVAVLRAALAEGMGASSAGFPGGAGSGAGSEQDETRGVQRIEVSRGDGPGSRGAC
jgi:hypothetical protein